MELSLVGSRALWWCRLNAEHCRSAMTMSEVSDMGGGIGLCFAVLRVRLLDLITTVIDFCAPPISNSSSVGYFATVSLRRHAVAQPEGHCRRVGGSTLRRDREQWAQIGLLAQVHAVLGGMLR